MTRKNQKSAKRISAAQARGIANVIELTHAPDSVSITTEGGRTFLVPIDQIVNEWKKQLKWSKR